MDADLESISMDGQTSDLAKLASQHYGFNSNGGKDSKRQEQQDFTIIWRNLSYKIKLKRWYHVFRNKNKRFVNQDEKVIFDNICGEAKSRQLTAIMGPSGAGKSSLLHCLFRNKTKGVTGQILVEQGYNKSKKNLKICFIPQHDYLNEWLTVREDLLFVSRLRFTNTSEIKDSSFFQKGDIEDSIESSSLTTSSTTTYVKHQKGTSNKTSLINHETNVLRMADLLGLTSCLDVPIKRISGGERKRLSIARELMSKPDILVLDEPTTGLDSLTCYKTVTVLRDLVKKTPNPMVVVVTIHQPERAVFNLFDKTYFLSNGRGVVFDEDPKNAIDVLKGVAKISLPSANYNPASFLIELACDKPYDRERILLTDYQKLRFDKSNSSSKIINLLGDKGLKSIQFSKFKSINMSQAIDVADTNVCITSLHISKQIDFDMATSSEPMLEVTDREKALLDGSDPNSYYISNQLADCANSHSNGMAKNFWHIFILTHRAWLSIIRNPSLTKSRLAFHMLLPLVMLAVFGFKMGTKDSCPILGEGLNIDRMRQDISEGTVSKNYDDYRYVCENVSFFFILYYGFAVNIVGIAASFYPLTLNMFRKETANGLYSVGPSLLAQIFAELPLEIFFPTISALLSYKLSGQVGSYLEWRMLIIGFIMFICSYFVQCLGLIAGILFNDNVSSAVIVGQMSLLPFAVTSGFGVRYSRLPIYMQYFAEWSIFKQFVSGFIAARYGFNMCDCNDEKLEDSQNTFLTPNLKHTMDYLFSNDTTLGENVKVTDLFDKLNDQFLKAQTYGMKLDTCDDVRPYIMDTFSVQDKDLYISLIFSIVGTIILKFVVYVLLKYKKL